MKYIEKFLDRWYTFFWNFFYLTHISTIKISIQQLNARDSGHVPLHRLLFQECINTYRYDIFHGIGEDSQRTLSEYTIATDRPSSRGHRTPPRSKRSRSLERPSSSSRARSTASHHDSDVYVTSAAYRPPSEMRWVARVPGVTGDFYTPWNFTGAGGRVVVRSTFYSRKFLNKFRRARIYTFVDVLRLNNTTF